MCEILILRGHLHRKPRIFPMTREASRVQFLHKVRSPVVRNTIHIHYRKRRFPKMRVPKNGRFIEQLEMDDWGYPYFRKPPYGDFLK